LVALLCEAAGRIECEVLYLSIQPDHVHLFIAAPPTLAPDQIMFRLKGYTSRALGQELGICARCPACGHGATSVVPPAWCPVPSFNGTSRSKRASRRRWLRAAPAARRLKAIRESPLLWEWAFADSGLWLLGVADRSAGWARNG
jgi:REP element-mobilizing transposase RayT